MTKAIIQINDGTRHRRLRRHNRLRVDQFQIVIIEEETMKPFISSIDEDFHSSAL
jgi:hypothetical protein